jgi:hypothetical protein
MENILTMLSMPYKDNTTEFIPENEQTEFRDPSISKYLGTA